MTNCDSRDCFVEALNFVECLARNNTLLGIVPADHLSNEAGHLINWLGFGFHGQMSFLARNPERRCDPRQVMPGCKSVIVCAMRYEEMPTRVSLRAKHSTKLSASTKQSPAGDCHVAPTTVVAPRNDMTLPKHLQHEDYHKVMMARLEVIASAIKQEHPKAQCKCYVDTGPVLEKAWAAHAGLGFIGKNTLLISPEHGSQMALSVILCSAVTPLCRSAVDSITAKQQNCRTTCGSCRKCLDACPTHALVAPYILDARKCISYKFFIGKEDGGCDICQDVCHFNKRRV